MKVLGQLESAQLENLTADPTPASIGQVYMNVLVAAAPQPRIYTQAGWRNLSMGQATGTIVTNAGKNATINWALGLVQQVNLTDNCTITFSNPVEGSVHTLIVQLVAQLASSNIPYTYKFAAPDIDSGRTPYQPPGVLIPFSTERVHRWLYKNGVKPASVLPPASATNSITPFLPGVPLGCMSVHPMQYAIVASKSATPFTWFQFLKVGYPLANGGPLTGYGGAGAVAPAAQPNNSAFSPDGEVFATAINGSTPFLQSSYCGITPIPANGYPFVTYSSPTALAGGSAAVGWHPSSSYIAAGCGASPFLYVFPHNRFQWGTKLADPASLPTGNCLGVAFNPTGDFLTTTTTVTPFIKTYAFNPASGGSIGAAIAAPATLAAGGSSFNAGTQICWRPQGDFIAMAMSVTPYIYVIPFDRVNGVYGTPLAVTGSAIPAGLVQSIKFTPDGQYLVINTSVSPYIQIYDFSSLTIGAPLTWLTAPIPVTDFDIDPSGEFLYFSGSSTPFFGAMSLPTKARSYVKLQ